MPLHSTSTEEEEHPNLEVVMANKKVPRQSATDNSVPSSTQEKDAPPPTSRATTSILVAAQPTAKTTTTLNKRSPPSPSTIRIASCPGGSLSGAFGTRLTPILPHALGVVAAGIGAPPARHDHVPVSERLLFRSNSSCSPQHPHRKVPTPGLITTVRGSTGDGDVPLRTEAPTVKEPLQVRLVAAMRRIGITWEVLAGEYQRAVSGYSRLSSETLQRWAAPKGDGWGAHVVGDADDRGACESLATAFIEDSVSLSELVADHFQHQHQNQECSLRGRVVDFAGFCRGSNIPLGDAAAWIDGGKRSGMGRIERSIGPQALSLLNHSAILRHQALQRDAHEQRKHQELVRRKHDRSKVVASPERIREGVAALSDGSPRDLLFAIEGGRDGGSTPNPKANVSEKRNASPIHSVTSGNAAPKAFQAISQYKSRFGRSETTPLSGLGDDVIVVVNGIGAGVHCNSPSVTNPSLTGLQVDVGHHIADIIPRWKKMADARPPVPMRPDSTTLRQNKKRDYRHDHPRSVPQPASDDVNTGPSPSNTNPVRITQNSRPEWYKDRQELEAVMRRRILSSERNVRNDVLVDAFFEPQGGNRAVVRDGGFPVIGLVAENIVNERREKQRAAVYRKELGDDW